VPHRDAADDLAASQFNAMARENRHDRAAFFRSDKHSPVESDLFLPLQAS
jgi:hypothetical protein